MGCEFLLVSLGEGFGSGSGGWGGLPVENKGKKGKGMGRVGGGVGTCKGTGKSLCKLCRSYPLAIYPRVSPLCKEDAEKHAGGSNKPDQNNTRGTALLVLHQSRFLGRGCDEALFSKKKGFSVKRREAIQ